MLLKKEIKMPPQQSFRTGVGHLVVSLSLVHSRSDFDVFSTSRERGYVVPNPKGLLAWHSIKSKCCWICGQAQGYLKPSKLS